MKREDYCDRWIKEFIDGEWVTRPETPSPQIDDPCWDENDGDEDILEKGKDDGDD